MKSNIKVVTEGFRAIGHAAIQISGITVVAGENSSGKSTISKLLYELFNTVANYEVLVKEELIREFNDLYFFFVATYYDKANNTKNSEIIERKKYDKIKELYSETYKDLSLEEIENALVTFLDDLYTNTNIYSDRYVNYISSVLGKKIDIKDSLQELKSFIKDRIKKADDKIHKRPTSLFTEKLLERFNQKLPSTLEVSEEGGVIVALDEPSVSISFLVQKAIYIDTPMSLSAYDYNGYWLELEKLLKRKIKGTHYSQEMSFQISENIKGESEYSDDSLSYTFSFKRKDGAVFDLNEVATGIKAFSIIQLLLKNGHIDNRTLLIIDEPESHLHPQWIVEYARMIVLLHKHIGVKFFLASHNPDMVSAIRYIAEKEEVLDNVNYYLAEKAEGETYLYNYTPLGSDISPIFKSFNIAIDRISQYSVDSDNEDDNL